MSAESPSSPSVQRGTSQITSASVSAPRSPIGISAGSEAAAARQSRGASAVSSARIRSTRLLRVVVSTARNRTDAVRMCAPCGITTAGNRSSTADGQVSSRPIWTVSLMYSSSSSGPGNPPRQDPQIPLSPRPEAAAWCSVESGFMGRLTAGEHGLVVVDVVLPGVEHVAQGVGVVARRGRALPGTGRQRVRWRRARRLASGPAARRLAGGSPRREQPGPDHVERTRWASHYCCAGVAWYWLGSAVKNKGLQELHPRLRLHARHVPLHGQTVGTAAVQTRAPHRSGGPRVAPCVAPCP